MSTGKFGVENIARTIDDVATVITDVKKAREEESAGGKKITLSELLGLVVSHSGKAVKLAQSIDEITDELADLEAKESPELVEALKKLYDPANPYVASGGEKMITGILWIKEGAEDLAKAKAWEGENNV
jgi:hypothetical protein